MDQLGQAGIFYYQRYPKADGGYDYIRTQGGYAPPGSDLSNSAEIQKYQPFSISEADTQAELAKARTANTAPAGGSTTTAPVVNRAAVDATQAAIDSLGISQSTGYKNIDDSLASLMGKYNTEASQNEGDYGTQTVTNTNNLEKNKENALLAAAQGRRGLRGTLASLGALSGDGARLADRAVATGANQDIGGAADTFATNAQNLDTSIGRFREEDKQRRADAQTSAINQKTALEGDIASKRQTLLQKLADIFGTGGDEASSSSYLRQAGALNPEIAAKTAVAATPLTAQAAAFTPKDLQSYLAGAGDMTVSTDPAAAGIRTPGSLLFGPQKKKEQQLAVA